MNPWSAFASRLSDEEVARLQSAGGSSDSASAPTVAGEALPYQVQGDNREISTLTGRGAIEKFGDTTSMTFPFTTETVDIFGKAQERNLGGQDNFANEYGESLLGKLPGGAQYRSMEAADLKQYAGTLGLIKINDMGEGEAGSALSYLGIDRTPDLRVPKRVYDHLTRDLDHMGPNQKALYVLAEVRNQVAQNYASERDKMGIVAKGVEGATNNARYAIEMMAGPAGFMALNTPANYAELRAPEMSVDPDTGRSVRVKDGAGVGEAAVKATVGTGAEYLIERVGGDLAGKAIGGVGRAGKAVVGRPLGWIVNKAGMTGVADAAGALARRGYRAAADMVPDVVKEFSPRAVEINKRLGLHTFAGEVMEESEQALVDAVFNLQNQYDSAGLKNVSPATQQFIEQLPEMVVSLGLMRGGQYAANVPANAAVKRSVMNELDGYRAMGYGTSTNDELQMTNGAAARPVVPERAALKKMSMDEKLGVLKDVRSFHEMRYLRDAGYHQMTDDEIGAMPVDERVVAAGEMRDRWYKDEFMKAGLDEPEIAKAMKQDAKQRDGLLVDARADATLRNQGLEPSQMSRRQKRAALERATREGAREAAAEVGADVTPGAGLEETVSAIATQLTTQEPQGQQGLQGLQGLQGQKLNRDARRAGVERGLVGEVPENVSPMERLRRWAENAGRVPTKVEAMGVLGADAPKREQVGYMLRMLRADFDEQARTADVVGEEYGVPGHVVAGVLGDGVDQIDPVDGGDRVVSFDPVGNDGDAEALERMYDLADQVASKPVKAYQEYARGLGFEVSGRVVRNADGQVVGVIGQGGGYTFPNTSQAPEHEKRALDRFNPASRLEPITNDELRMTNDGAGASPAAQPKGDQPRNTQNTRKELSALGASDAVLLALGDGDNHVEEIREAAELGSDVMGGIVAGLVDKGYVTQSGRFLRVTDKGRAEQARIWDERREMRNAKRETENENAVASPAAQQEGDQPRNTQNTRKEEKTTLPAAANSTGMVFQDNAPVSSPLEMQVEGDRAEKSPKSSTMLAERAIRETMVNVFGSRVGYRVVKSKSALPKGFVSAAEQRFGESVDTLLLAGVHYKGQVWFVVDDVVAKANQRGMSVEAVAVATVMHEWGVHVGIRKMAGRLFGDKAGAELDKLLRQVVKSVGRDEIVKVIPMYAGETNDAVLAEEYLAKLAERIDANEASAVERTAWDQVVEFFRALLSKVSGKLTDGEVYQIVRMAVASAKADANSEVGTGNAEQAGASQGQPLASEVAGQDVEMAPSEAQKAAGNYKKGHIKWGGMDISIENPAGAVRRGVDRDGTAWETAMRHDYGYIRGSKGYDKDHVDVFINSGAPEGGTVYVVNQVNPKTGKFDEHKAMLGFGSEEAARTGYLSNYQAGWKGLGSVVAMPADEFKVWALGDGPKRGALEMRNAEHGTRNAEFDDVTEGGEQGLLFSSEQMLFPLDGFDNEGVKSTKKISEQEALANAKRALERLSALAGGKPGVIRTIATYVDTFRSQGYVDLRNRAVQSLDELAQLVQIWRDPRYETHRFVYFNDAGVILAHEAITSRLPGMTQISKFASMKDAMDDIVDRMRRLGATHVYSVHNHPSGNVTPSSTDIDLMRGLGKHLPGFRGAIVIDHDTYAFIRPDGRHDQFMLPVAGQPFTKPAPKFSEPSEVAAFLSAVVHTDRAVPIVIVDNQMRPRILIEVPASWFNEKNKTAVGSKLRKLARSVGGVNAFAAWPASREYSAIGRTLKDLYWDEVLRDVVFLDGNGGLSHGLPQFERKTWMGQRKAPRVRVEDNMFRKKQPPTPGQKGWGDGDESLRAERARAEGKRTSADLARDYGVSQDTVRRFLKTREWHHVVKKGRVSPGEELFYDFTPETDDVHAEQLQQMRDHESGKKSDASKKRMVSIAASEMGLRVNWKEGGLIKDADGGYVGRASVRQWGQTLALDGSAPKAQVDLVRGLAKRLGLNEGVAGDNTYGDLWESPQEAQKAQDEPHADPDNDDIILFSAESRDRQIRTPEFKRWFGNWEQFPERASKVVDEDGKPKVVYHGAKRPDRIGTKFDPKRATSGPMAFFTDAPNVASGYAEGKTDTSLTPPATYAEWFKVKAPGARNPVDIARAWNYLTQEQRQMLNERLPHIVNHDANGDTAYGDNGDYVFRYDPNEFGLAGADHWQWTLREKRGNMLATAADIWLDSGALFNSESEFLKVLELAGLTDVEFDSPYREHPGVFPVYLNIRTPLITSDVTPSVIEALRDAGKRKRASKAKSSGDMWDKNNISGSQWLSELDNDIATGSAHAWTSIPDWVTDTLKRLGYDGIHDTGGKMGGEKHSVWIPFRPNQIKSATGNRGTFDSSKDDIRFSAESRRLDSELLSGVYDWVERVLLGTGSKRLLMARTGSADATPQENARRVQRVRKADKNERPELAWWRTVLGTPLHNFKRVPALKKIWDIVMDRNQARHEIRQALFGDNGMGSDDLRDIVAYMNAKKDEFTARWAPYLLRRDRDAIGYKVKAADGGMWELVNPLGAPVGAFKTDEEAWSAAFDAERADMVGGVDYYLAGDNQTVKVRKTAPMSEQAGDALVRYRQTFNRTWQHLSGLADRLEREYEDNGETPPSVMMDGEPVSVFAAMRVMGDLRGHYMPRLRRGQYLLYAIKRDADGNVVDKRMETFDTRIMRQGRAGQLAKEGYEVDKARSNKPSEEAFLDVSVTSLNDLLQNALDRLKGQEQAYLQQSLDTLLGPGVEVATFDYTRKDGTVEKHVAVKGAPRNLTNMFKTLPGYSGRYDAGGTDKAGQPLGEAWQFVGDPKEVKQVIARGILHQQHMDSGAFQIYGRAMAEQFAAMLHSRGSRARKISRNGARGTEVWGGYEQDPVKALVAAVSGIAGGTAKAEMARKMVNAMMGVEQDWKDYKADNLPDGYDDMDPEAKRGAQTGLWERYFTEINERRIDSARQPEAFRDAQAFIREMMRNDTGTERMFGVLKGVAALKYLSGLSAGVVNMSSLLTTVPAVFHQDAKIPFEETLKRVADMGGKYGRYRLALWKGTEQTIDDDTAWLFSEIHKRGWDEALMNTEATSVLQGAVSAQWQKVMKWSMIVFSLTESMNRASTIAAGYDALKSRHTGEWTDQVREELLIKARDMANNAHAVYGKENLPSWMRGDTAGAQFLRAMYMYRTYIHNVYQLMAGMGVGKQKDKAALGYLLSSTVALGGLGSMVGAPVIAAVMKQVLRAFMDTPPDDPELALYQWIEEQFGGTARRLAQGGVPGAAGVYLGGSISMGLDAPPVSIEEILSDPDTAERKFLGWIGQTITGPAWSMVTDFGKGAVNVAQGDVLRGVERGLMPRALRGISQGAREYFYGVRTQAGKPVFWGDEPLRPSAMSAVLRAAGFQSMEIMEKRSQQWSETQIKRQYAMEKKDLMLRLDDAVQSGRFDHYAEVLADIENLNRRIRAYGYRFVPQVTAATIKGHLKRQFTAPKSERERTSTTPLETPRLPSFGEARDAAE